MKMKFNGKCAGCGRSYCNKPLLCNSRMLRDIHARNWGTPLTDSNGPVELTTKPKVDWDQALKALMGEKK